jgi:predicted RNase H-like HicB family nuclease
MVKNLGPVKRLLKRTPLHVLLEKEDRWYVGHCLELGITSQGRTRKRCLAMVREAVESWLEAASKEEVGYRIKKQAKRFCELSLG